MISALLCESRTERRRGSDFMGRGRIGADLDPGSLFYSCHVSLYLDREPLSTFPAIESRRRSGFIFIIIGFIDEVLMFLLHCAVSAVIKKCHMWITFLLFVTSHE